MLYYLSLLIAGFSSQHFAHEPEFLKIFKLIDMFNTVDRIFQVDQIQGKIIPAAISKCKLDAVVVVGYPHAAILSDPDFAECFNKGVDSLFIAHICDVSGSHVVDQDPDVHGMDFPDPVEVFIVECFIKIFPRYRYMYRSDGFDIFNFHDLNFNPVCLLGILYVHLIIADLIID